MKLSVSLADEDLSFIDEYADRHGSGSRSAVLHDAIATLRLAELEEAYAEAWREWDETPDAALWDGATGDGVA